MVERRWLLGLGPPVVATLALGVLASGSLGAGRAWQPPPCPGGTAAMAVTAKAGAPQVAGVPVPHAWFTIDPELDASGTVTGQQLRIGIGSERERHIDLPPESAAAGPFGGLVLVVADDGRRSEIRAIDRLARCAWRLGGSADVIRRVTLDPQGEALYEFRVARATRADLGVWRRPLDGGVPRRVLGPLPADPRFGRTWTTTLGWSIEGDRLAIQQCGAVHCRTRLLDPARSAVTELDAPGQGELVGVAEGLHVAYAACGGLPCPIVATTLADGHATTIADAAGLAAIVSTEDGIRLAVETLDRVELRLLDGSVELDLDQPGSDTRLVPSVHGATAGHGLPPGWIAWAPDGRSPDGATLTRLSDGTTVGVVEVTP